MTEIIPQPAKDIELGNQLPLDQNPAAVYLRGLTPQAARVMRIALNRIARILGAPLMLQDVRGRPQDWTCLSVNWAGIRAGHAKAIQASLHEPDSLGKTYSQASINRMLSALRGVLGVAWDFEQISDKDYLRTIRAIKGKTPKRLPAGRMVTANEIQALFIACENDQSPAGIRDAAMIAIMAAAGPRREELASFTLADYDLDSREWRIIGGKGNKDRSGYLENEAADAMAAWLEIRGNDPGGLFLPIKKSGVIGSGRITAQAVYNVIAKRAAQAGISHITPHDFRRTLISNLFDSGVDIAIIGKIVGHENPKTTARYDRRPEQAKREAARKIHLPYTRRAIPQRK